MRVEKGLLQKERFLKWFRIYVGFLSKGTDSVSKDFQKALYYLSGLGFRALSSGKNPGIE